MEQFFVSRIVSLLNQLPFLPARLVLQSSEEEGERDVGVFALDLDSTKMFPHLRPLSAAQPVSMRAPVKPAWWEGRRHYVDVKIRSITVSLNLTFFFISF